jgi:hypothetical protein
MADTAVVGALARIEPQLATEAIANQRFIRQLDELRKLKEFLFEEKVQFKQKDLDSIDLEELNNLSYSTTGRVPNAGEWRTLDEKLTKLTSYLGDDLRRKIRIRELKLFFRTLPIIFLVSSVFSSMIYLNHKYFPNPSSPWRLLFWLAIVSIWAASQGGLGACAFLGTSVIMKSSTTNESTPRENVDLIDRNFFDHQGNFGNFICGNSWPYILARRVKRFVLILLHDNITRRIKPSGRFYTVSCRLQH